MNGETTKLNGINAWLRVCGPCHGNRQCWLLTRRLAYKKARISSTITSQSCFPTCSDLLVCAVRNDPTFFHFLLAFTFFQELVFPTPPPPAVVAKRDIRQSIFFAHSPQDKLLAHLLFERDSTLALSTMKFSVFFGAALCGVASAVPFVSRQSLPTPDQIAALAVDLGALPDTNPNRMYHLRLCPPRLLTPKQPLVIVTVLGNPTDRFPRFRVHAHLFRTRISRYIHPRVTLAIKTTSNQFNRL
jgi:hypothetical protein